MAKLTKDMISSLTELTDEIRADLSARFDEITELQGQIDKLTREKQDADKIVARAGEVETANRQKDAKILELESLIAKHTQQPVEKGSYGIFGGFFQD